MARIYALRFGKKGPAIVFLHGWQQTGRSFAPLVPFLYSRYQLFLPDLPGFGQSPSLASSATSKDYAQAIYNWTRQQNLHSFYLVGHSFGGKVAAVLAANYPKSVKKLVLVASAGIPHPRWWYSFLRRIPPKTKQTFRRYLPDFLFSRDYRQAGHLRPIFRNIIHEDLRPVLPKVKASTLIIWGEDDRELPVDDAQIIHQLIPSSQLTILPHLGHFPFWQEPEKVVRLIDAFLHHD